MGILVPKYNLHLQWVKIKLHWYCRLRKLRAGRRDVRGDREEMSKFRTKYTFILLITTLEY